MDGTATLVRVSLVGRVAIKPTIGRQKSLLFRGAVSIQKRVYAFRGALSHSHGKRTRQMLIQGPQLPPRLEGKFLKTYRNPKFFQPESTQLRFFGAPYPQCVDESFKAQPSPNDNFPIKRPPYSLLSFPRKVAQLFAPCQTVRLHSIRHYLRDEC